MREPIRQLIAGQNQFASGGLVLMLIGAAVAWLIEMVGLLFLGFDDIYL